MDADLSLGQKFQQLDGVVIVAAGVGRTRGQFEARFARILNDPRLMLMQMSSQNDVAPMMDFRFARLGVKGRHMRPWVVHERHRPIRAGRLSQDAVYLPMPQQQSAVVFVTTSHPRGT